MRKSAYWVDVSCLGGNRNAVANALVSQATGSKLYSNWLPNFYGLLVD